MRPESTPQGETCKWPESDCPGWVSHLRTLTTTLSHRPRIPQAQDPRLSPCLIPVCTSTPVIMQGMHELCQAERVFQDPRKEEGLIEAQFILGEGKEVEEEDEEEQKVEKEEEDEQVEGGGASRGRRCSYFLLLLVRGTWKK